MQLFGQLVVYRQKGFKVDIILRAFQESMREQGRPLDLSLETATVLHFTHRWLHEAETMVVVASKLEIHSGFLSSTEHAFFSVSHPARRFRH